MSGKKGMKHYSREVKLDRHLLNTFLELVMAIIMHRHRNHGLLLSELEGYLLGQNMAGRGRNGSVAWYIVQGGM